MFVCIKRICSHIFALPSPLDMSISPMDNRNWDLAQRSAYQSCPAAAAKSLQSCPTLQPQRRQPTRLPSPWDSPGKNTGVGFHFLLQCMKVKSESEPAQSCPISSDPMDCSPPCSSVHGIFQARVLELGVIAFSRKYLY